jgi:hypothetical protein
MNPRRYFRNIASNLCALALLCAATGAPAQTIYKQVDLAGRVTFTDRPDINLPAQAMTGAAHAMPNPALDAPKPPAMVGLMTSRRSASIDVNEAGLRLARAQLQRSGGADLLPGDLTHGSGEGVPNQRYWQRQDKLRVQVEKAQQRSNETRLALLAQR